MQSSTNSNPGLEQRLLHMNIPQQRAFVVNAKTTVFIGGRGTGKTTGVMAPQSIRNAQAFPRGAEAFVNGTYVKLRGDLKAAWTDAMEKWGFYEGVDYWWGRPIPKHINHVKPFQAGDVAEYQVNFPNGHVKRLIGLDKNKTSGNALSVDFVTVDEAKFINVKQFNSRIVPTNRGNEDIWSDIPYHHGFTYLSDMPTSPESQFLLDFEDFHDEELVNLIASYQLELDETQLEYDKLKDTLQTLKYKDQLHEKLEGRLRRRLAELNNILDELRRDCVLFLESTTLDNIDILGAEYIRQMEMILTPFEFETSILGKRVFAVDHQYYCNFNSDTHTDDQTINYRYINLIPDLTKGIPNPWRKDLDLDHTLPLQISCDWGSRISCMTVAQNQPSLFRYINEFFVKGGGKMKELAKAFSDYYEDYSNRDLIFYYDHTANHTDTSREKTYAQEFEQYLREYGWKVRSVYIGQAAAHPLKYKMWARVMKGYGTDKPIMINKHNCKNLLISLQLAGAIEAKGGTWKDKRPERNDSVKQETATHFTDAFDTTYIGCFAPIKAEDIMDYGITM